MFAKRFFFWTPEASVSVENGFCLQIWKPLSSIFCLLWSWTSLSLRMPCWSAAQSVQPLAWQLVLTAQELLIFFSYKIGVSEMSEFSAELEFPVLFLVPCLLTILWYDQLHGWAGLQQLGIMLQGDKFIHISFVLHSKPLGAVFCILPHRSVVPEGSQGEGKALVSKEFLLVLEQIDWIFP